MLIDYYLFTLINQYAGWNQYIDQLAMFLAVYLIFAFAILLFLEIKNRKLLVNAVVSSVGVYSLKYLITLFYFRPRPFAVNNVNLLIEHAKNASFPSNHAAISFAIATSIFLYNRKYGVIALVMAAFISLSRVFVGVHYISDIVAGALIGAIASYAAFYLIKWLSKTKRIKWLQ